MSCVRESEFRIVSCAPRVSVSACGQITLFWITSVFAFVLGVQPPLGLVLDDDDDDEPPHDMAAAIAAATAPKARSLAFRIATILACTSPGNRRGRAG